MHAGYPAHLLEDIQESAEIAGDIGLGMIQRIPHAGLCRKMNDAVRTIREEPLNSVTVSKITLNQLIVGISGEYGVPCPFQGRIIVAVEAVKTAHTMPLRKEPAGKMKTDKSGAAGDDILHGHLSTYRMHLARKSVNSIPERINIESFAGYDIVSA